MKPRVKVTLLHAGAALAHFVHLYLFPFTFPWRIYGVIKSVSHVHMHTDGSLGVFGMVNTKQ